MRSSSAQSRTIALHAHDGDVDRGDGGAHPTVALVLDQADGAGVGHREVHTRDPDPGVQEDGPQPGSRVDGFGRDVGLDHVAGVGREQPGDRVAVVVDRRGDDVRRRLPCELDDELAEVGLDDLSAVGFEDLVEMDLLAGHRLALGHDPRVVRPGPVRRRWRSLRCRRRAQWTWPPTASNRFDHRSSTSGRSAMTAARTCARRPAAHPDPPGRSAPATRVPDISPVALRTAARRRSSRRSRSARERNVTGPVVVAVMIVALRPASAAGSGPRPGDGSATAGNAAAPGLRGARGRTGRRRPPCRRRPPTTRPACRRPWRRTRPGA